MTALEPIRLKPALIERVWAGHRLRNLLAKVSPEGLSIGESWELSDHPSAPSGFAEGEFRDLSFGEVFRDRSRGIFDLPTPSSPYPLLVKYIDAGQSLSIQVHPDDECARKHGSSGKSECWFVVDCEPDSYALCGFKPGVSPETLRTAAVSGDFDAVLVKRPIRPGTFVNVPAGTVHAILKGTLVCEISQTSSEIARLWDWGREPSANRRLDLETAVEYSNFHPLAAGDRNEQPFDIDTADWTGDQILVRNRHFEVRLMSLGSNEPGRSLTIANPHGTVISVVQGTGSWSWGTGKSSRLSMGETWLLPAHLQTLQLETEEAHFRFLISSPLGFS